MKHNESYSAGRIVPALFSLIRFLIFKTINMNTQHPIVAQVEYQERFFDALQKADAIILPGRGLTKLEMKNLPKGTTVVLRKGQEEALKFCKHKII